MLFKSALLTQISGSIGGLTGSHNRGGLYFRARAIPVNTNTIFQQVVRNAMTQLTTRWGDVLTQTQRDAWELYGEQVPLTNKLGNEVQQSGISAYVRSNVPRVQGGHTKIDDGPTNFNLSGFSDPQNAVFDTAGQQLTFDIDNTDLWANDDDSFMLVYVSRPQNVTINYFKGPYRLAGNVPGDGTTPPTTSQSFAVPFPIAVGQRCFYQVRVTRSDGRLTGTFREGEIVVA